MAIFLAGGFHVCCGEKMIKNQKRVGSMAFFMLAALLPKTSLSHGNDHHAPLDDSSKKDALAKKIEQTALSYRASVEPIFKQKCFDCHSVNTVYPWYNRVPIVKQMIQRDISTARQHIEMTKGFPFEGHGSPQDDLEAIRKVIQNKSMPPLRYRLMHPHSTLTDSEKQIVLNWINQSPLNLKAR